MLIATATAASFDYDRQMHELLEINANFNCQTGKGIESNRIKSNWIALKAVTEHAIMLFGFNIIIGIQYIDNKIIVLIAD